MSVTYVTEGDSATPAYMNTLLNLVSGDVYNVKSYDATGDGSTDDRDAMQDALDAANVAGGGVVYVPPGTYMIGASNGASPASTGGSSLQIGSNTHLRMDPAATIIRRHAGTAEENATIRNMDFSSGNTNVRISGGTIKSTNSSNTGMHVALVKCSRVHINEMDWVGIYDHWNLYLEDCTNVAVNGILIDSGDTTTEDGLHICGGSKISISNSIIISGDDAIAITQESSFCELDASDIVVDNCYLYSKSATGFKVDVDTGQSPTTRSINRVTLSNCVLRSAGIGLAIRDLTNG